MKNAIFLSLLLCTGCTAYTPPFQYADAQQCYIRTEGSESRQPLIHALIADRTLPQPLVPPPRFEAALKAAVKRGCNLEERDSAKLTPLQAAVLFNDETAAALLLKLGADPHSRIARPGSPLDGKNAAQMAAVLEAAERRQGQPKNRRALRQLLQPYRD